MRISFLGICSFAMTGLFESYGHLMSTGHVKLIPASFVVTKTNEVFRRGLKVKISPDVEFTNKGILKESAESKNLQYAVTLVIEDNPPTDTQLRWERDQHWFKTARKYIFNGIKVDAILIYECGSNTQTIGWELNWSFLDMLVQKKVLFPFPQSSINPEAYVSNYLGLYSFTWEKDEGPRFHFTEEAFSGIITHEGDNVDLVYLGKLLLGKIKFEFGNEATQIPPEVFETITTHKGKQVGYRKFSLLNGRYRAKCDFMDDFTAPDAYTKYNPFSLGLTFHGATSQVEFNTAEYIVKNDDKCTLHIESSAKDKEWVLGSSFLRAFNVIIDTTEKTKKRYEILPIVQENLVAKYKGEH